MSETHSGCGSDIHFSDISEPEDDITNNPINHDTATPNPTSSQSIRRVIGISSIVHQESISEPQLLNTITTPVITSNVSIAGERDQKEVGSETEENEEEPKSLATEGDSDIEIDDIEIEDMPDSIGAEFILNYIEEGESSKVTILMNHEEEEETNQRKASSSHAGNITDTEEVLGGAESDIEDDSDSGKLVIDQDRGNLGDDEEEMGESSNARKESLCPTDSENYQVDSDARSEADVSDMHEDLDEDMTTGIQFLIQEAIRQNLPEALDYVNINSVPEGASREEVVAYNHIEENLTDTEDMVEGQEHNDKEPKQSTSQNSSGKTCTKLDDSEIGGWVDVEEIAKSKPGPSN